MKATFSIENDGETLRVTGEVVKRNNKTTVIKATLPEDFGGRTIVVKRHNEKHNVEFDED